MEELKVATSNVSELNTNEVTASANVLVSTTHSVSGNLSVRVHVVAIMCMMYVYYFDSCLFCFWMLSIVYHLLTEAHWRKAKHFLTHLESQ